MPPVLDQTRLSSQEKLLAEVRKKYPEYHPVIAMAELAHETENEALEFMCHKEVAKYTVAVDKNVQIDERITRTRRVVVELFDGGHGTNIAQHALTLDEDGRPVLPAPKPYSDTEALATCYEDIDTEVFKRTMMRFSGASSDDSITDVDPRRPVSPRLKTWEDS